MLLSISGAALALSLVSGERLPFNIERLADTLDNYPISIHDDGRVNFKTPAVIKNTLDSTPNGYLSGICLQSFQGYQDGVRLKELKSYLGPHAYNVIVEYALFDFALSDYCPWNSFQDCVDDQFEYVLNQQFAEIPPFNSVVNQVMEWFTYWVEQESMDGVNIYPDGLVAWKTTMMFRFLSLRNREAVDLSYLPAKEDVEVNAVRKEMTSKEKRIAKYKKTKRLETASADSSVISSAKKGKKKKKTEEITSEIEDESMTSKQKKIMKHKKSKKSENVEEEEFDENGEEWASFSLSISADSDDDEIDYDENDDDEENPFRVDCYSINPVNFFRERWMPIQRLLKLYKVNDIGHAGGAHRGYGWGLVVRPSLFVEACAEVCVRIGFGITFDDKQDTACVHTTYGIGEPVDGSEASVKLQLDFLCQNIQRESDYYGEMVSFGKRVDNDIQFNLLFFTSLDMVGIRYVMNFGRMDGDSLILADEWNLEDYQDEDGVSFFYEYSGKLACYAPDNVNNCPEGGHNGGASQDSGPGMSGSASMSSPPKDSASMDSAPQPPQPPQPPKPPSHSQGMSGSPSKGSDSMPSMGHPGSASGSKGSSSKGSASMESAPKPPKPPSHSQGMSDSASKGSSSKGSGSMGHSGSKGSASKGSDSMDSAPKPPKPPSHSQGMSGSASKGSASKASGGASGGGSKGSSSKGSASKGSASKGSMSGSKGSASMGHSAGAGGSKGSGSKGADSMPSMGHSGGEGGSKGSSSKGSGSKGSASKGSDSKQSMGYSRGGSMKASHSKKSASKESASKSKSKGHSDSKKGGSQSASKKSKDSGSKSRGGDSRDSRMDRDDEEAEVGMAYGGGENTAFAYVPDHSACSLDNPNLRGQNKDAGWAIELTPGEILEGTIYAGAIQCDLDRGIPAGTFKLSKTDCSVTVSIDMYDDSFVGTMHIHIANTPYANENGQISFEPSKYNQQIPINENKLMYRHTFTNVCENNYVIIHQDVNNAQSAKSLLTMRIVRPNTHKQSLSSTVGMITFFAAALFFLVGSFGVQLIWNHFTKNKLVNASSPQTGAPANEFIAVSTEATPLLRGGMSVYGSSRIGPQMA